MCTMRRHTQQYIRLYDWRSFIIAELTDVNHLLYTCISRLKGFGTLLRPRHL